MLGRALPLQLVLAAALATAVCAQDMGDMPGFGVDESVGARAAPVKAEVKFLSCAVCERLVENLAAASTTLREKNADEEAVIEHVEKSCDPQNDEGEWIAKLDIDQGDGGALTLHTQPSFGKCQRECSTVARACERVSKGQEMELGEALYRGVRLGGKSAAKLQGRLHKMLCKKHCSAKKQRAVMKNKRKDEVFAPITEQERSMATMLRKTPGAQLMKRDGVGEMSPPATAAPVREQARAREPLVDWERLGLQSSLPTNSVLGTVFALLLVVLFLALEYTELSAQVRQAEGYLEKKSTVPAEDPQKAVHVVTQDELRAKAGPAGGTVCMCRCYKSAEFPYCDGSHTAHNKATGDNAGPLVVKLPPPPTFTHPEWVEAAFSAALVEPPELTGGTEG